MNEREKQVKEKIYSNLFVVLSYEEVCLIVDEVLSRKTDEIYENMSEDEKEEMLNT